MITEPVEMAHASRNRAMGRHLFLSFIALIFTLTFSPSKAHAQITAEMEANIPFQFHVGNTKFPAGKYTIRQFDDESNPNVMEISSVTGNTSALFEVETADGNNSLPKSELTFNKYGKRYFLAGLYDANDPIWMKVPESRYEKKIGEATTEAQAHVPVVHRGQQAKGN
jgi:hypothetical protein